jgi:hypothetical protein
VALGGDGRIRLLLVLVSVGGLEGDGDGVGGQENGEKCF